MILGLGRLGRVFMKHSHTPIYSQKLLKHTWSLGQVPLAPKLLGVAGLLPFVSSTLGIYFLPHFQTDLLTLQSFYGCSILSFMGAVHWGLSMTEYGGLEGKGNSIRYVLSTVPSLIGFFSLLIPFVPVQLIMQLCGFNLLLLSEVYAHKKQFIPSWYLGLRVGLTLIVNVCVGSSLWMCFHSF